MISQAGKTFSRSKIFLIVCLVFIFGLAAASFSPLNFFQFEIWWFGVAVFFLVLTFLSRAAAETSITDGRQLALPLNRAAGQADNKFFIDSGLSLKSAAFYFLLASILFFSFWRYGVSLPEDAPDKIWHYNQSADGSGGRAVIARGIISKEPDIRESSQKLEINVSEICLDNESGGECRGLKARGKVLVTTALYPEYKYGDELVFQGELKQPEEFNGFAYDRYLARYEIYSVCYYPKILPPLSLPLSKGESTHPDNWFYGKIFVLKNFLTGLIDAGLSEPESSLARPVVFGGQRGLEQKIRDDFQKVGLTHIMAVSGFNISIIAAIVMAGLLASGLNRRQAFYLAVMFLAVYIIIVGAPASAMRAGLMGVLVLWALKLGRLNKITNSLVLTAAILLLINPKLLRDDVGFQLSFLAIAGLVYVYPILEALWQKMRLPKFKGVSDALLITLAAQVFTLPILAYNFSQISLIAPLANLAVLWAVPILTILILAALPLAALLPNLAFIFFLPSLILTKYILATVKFFAAWPHSYLTVDYLSPLWIVLYYFLAIFLVIKARRSKLLSQEISGKM